MDKLLVPIICKAADKPSQVSDRCDSDNKSGDKCSMGKTVALPVASQPDTLPAGGNAGEPVACVNVVAKPVESLATVTKDKNKKKVKGKSIKPKASHFQFKRALSRPSVRPFSVLVPHWIGLSGAAAG